MKYIDEFRDKHQAEKLLKAIRELKPSKKITLMEVCGSHTMAIGKNGLRSRLPEWIKLVSGPGCPVCVTSIADIDKAIFLSQQDNVIITTYGDMIRVPGTSSSLQLEKSKGHQIKIVYSSHDALQLAMENPTKKIIFLGIGFETTAPTIASTLETAKQRDITNFFILSLHKLVPPALLALLESEDLEINGFILPGHVSAIIGSDIYQFIATDYKVPGVIAGFEVNDILQSIYMLVNLIIENKANIEIGYRRVVTKEGNCLAQKKMNDVFEIKDSYWRGIGIIKNSGLYLNKKYADFDADLIFKIPSTPNKETDTHCLCGSILKGIKTPTDCPLFAKACLPATPVGPCMVSSEGTCAAYYKYGDN